MSAAVQAPLLLPKRGGGFLVKGLAQAHLQVLFCRILDCGRLQILACEALLHAAAGSGTSIGMARPSTLCSTAPLQSLRAWAD